MGRDTYSNGTTPNICIVGAGCSGLMAGIKLKSELGLTTFTIFDENDGVGGKWHKNTFPGCRSVSKSHLVSYSFDMKPDWTKNYAPQEEILDYLREVTRRHSMYPYIQFHSEVKSLVYNPTQRKWNATIYNKLTRKQDELTFDIVICANGKFREAVVPDEFKSFRGPIIHTGAWDSSVDLEDKVVGVVGSGSSAIQIIPAIVPKVKCLHCYQRDPAWVLPCMDFEFPKITNWIFGKITLILLIFRWFLFWENELCYPAFIHNSWFNQIARYMAERHLSNQVSKNARLRWDLLPKYTIGCKPIHMSNDYYPAMVSGRVTLHTDPVVRVKDNAVVTSLDGSQKLDILILATGFKVQEFFGPMTITDKLGQDLLTRWKASRVRIRSYYGITTSFTPNLFFILGPNTSVVHASPNFIAECQMSFIILLIKEMMLRDAFVVEVKEAAEDEFLDELEKQMKKTVWKREKCKYWFTNTAGAVTALWPWSSIKYWRRTRNPDFVKFKFN